MLFAVDVLENNLEVGQIVLGVDWGRRDKYWMDEVWKSRRVVG